MPAGGQVAARRQSSSDQCAEIVMRPLASAQAVEEWASSARPGEIFIYHSGDRLVQSLPAVTAARSLHDRGEVLLFQKKLGPGQYDYCIQKRANAERQLSAGQLAGRPVGTAIDQEEYDQLIAVLRRLANFKLPCPTNRELAQLAELKDAESVRYRLTQLSIAGVIIIRTPPQGPRVITIAASGRSTAQ